jgi:hypothetical protein
LSGRTARSTSATPTITASARWRVASDGERPPRLTGFAALFAAVVAAGLLFGHVANAAEALDAVTTPRRGTLTMCLDWFVYDSCNTYHHIALPPRIAVGDRVKLTYGSNPKDYIFHVVRIHRSDDGCTILSDRSGKNGTGERIEVSPCQPATNPGKSAGAGR